MYGAFWFEIGQDLENCTPSKKFQEVTPEMKYSDVKLKSRDWHSNSNQAVSHALFELRIPAAAAAAAVSGLKNLTMTHKY